ncbi:MAG: bifunctional 5,10-methylenetetrahydrofolate dehydrogenase/5,10-methenyltetrahydrofolate cyclohydrolase [Planctomycetes bacterium]|nr:bifunctional 5,10-methylenetetrahydrofolate dehydrogenase/5,10-methenyltetrahydrofolate cyclohydrolase [Planctomycetota bacterium]MCP4838056.1 bifunctional 5,10-methylenetetrahydrofolate dehydrogenase/5,10-methenyltetrahydrofolate cyclohydrolase [Planctomycetota bacterium]
MSTAETAKIIDGRELADAVKRELATRVAELAANGISVRLDVVLAAGNPAGSVYARNQASMCEEIGIDYRLHEVACDADSDCVADAVQSLNVDPAVTAIMVHLPLPDGVDTMRIQSMIDAGKDVEGVNPANIGGVIYGRRTLVPCTALATMRMIEATGINLVGAEVVCVGASTIVGRPVAVLLMEAQATVISTNVHTVDLASHVRGADVVIVAAGVPGLVTRDMVKPGAVVIDVGINRIEDENGDRRTVGDVDFESVSSIAGWLSPVPGGVGPMTVAMLLRNTVAAADHG